MSRTCEETRTLGRRRADALQAFLDSNMELFGPDANQDEERDPCLDCGEVHFPTQPPFMITGAVLITRARDCGESEYSMWCQTPNALGWTEILGMVESMRRAN